MTKKIIREYFEAFRWERLKAIYKNWRWWPYLYMLFVFPSIAHVYENRNGMLIFYLIMVPFLYCVLSASLHGMILPKIMYLCPMGWDKRKEYITKTCIFRTMIPIMIGLLCTVALVLTGACDGILGVAIFLNQAIASVIYGFAPTVKGYGTNWKNGRREIDWNTQQGILEGVVTAIAIIISIFSAVLVAENSPLIHWIKWGCLVAVIFVELPLTIIDLKLGAKNMQQLLYYEGRYKL